MNDEGAYTVEVGDTTFKGVTTDDSAIINGVAFVAVDELTVNVDEDGEATLFDGTVIVSSEFSALDGDAEISVTSDEDGVIVTVEDGVVTSITDLEDGVVVEYDGKTYTMSGDTLIISNDDISVTYTGGETVNILAPEGLASVFIPVAAGEAIDLAEGIDALELADIVTYGTTDGTDTTTIATLVEGEDEGTYDLTVDDGTEVDATGLAEGEAVTFTPVGGDEGITVDGTNYKGTGNVTLNGSNDAAGEADGVGSVDLGNDVEVTGADDEQVFNIDPKATATINGQTFDNSASDKVTPLDGVIKTDDGFIIADQATVDVYPASETYTVATDKDGNVVMEGVTDGASIEAEGDIDIATDGAGTVTINDEPYTVAGDADGAVFTIDDGELASISGLESGAVTGNFESPLTVNREGNVVEVDTEDDDPVTVEVTGNGGRFHRRRERNWHSLRRRDYLRRRNLHDY